MLAGIATAVAISFNIMLPVVPVLLERGGPHGAAGAGTAALFVGAVAGEVLTPWLMSRWSSSRLLVGGQLMIAVPSLAYVLPHLDAWLMLAAAAARGLGMGIAIVVAVALVAEFAAPDRRGRSIGFFGVALSAPGIVLPSVGVALLEAGHADADGLIAFVVGLAGALVTFKLPRPPAPPQAASANLLAAFRRPGLLSLYAGFVLVSCSFGAVITFAPIALPTTGIGLRGGGVRRRVWRRPDRRLPGHGGAGIERAPKQHQRPLEQRDRPRRIPRRNASRPRGVAIWLCRRHLGDPRRGVDLGAPGAGAGQGGRSVGALRRRPEDHEHELLLDLVKVMGL